MAMGEEISDKIPIRIYTFGKAMGVHGACVCGSQTLIDYLVNYARPFIYTTALPMLSIASIDCAFNYLERNSKLIQELHQKVQFYLSEMSNVGSLNCTLNQSPIQTIMAPGNDHAKSTSSTLRNHGLDVRPILSPTVKEGTERLRICLHTYNSEEEIMLLANSIKDLAKA
jgi:8-amino-7-oxononanoate synthase